MKGIIIILIVLLLMGGVTSYILYRMDRGVLKESLDLMRTGNLDAGLQECANLFFDSAKDMCAVSYLTLKVSNLLGKNNKVTEATLQEYERLVVQVCPGITEKKAKRQCDNLYDDLSDRRRNAYFENNLGEDNPLLVFHQTGNRHLIGFYNPLHRDEKLPLQVTCNDPRVRIKNFNFFDIAILYPPASVPFGLAMADVDSSAISGRTTCTVTVQDGRRNLQKDFTVEAS